ncbi:MAG: hypothetical protein LBP70_02625 [Mycoplasmataceae bacterium]|nr:hypothetical protein [Mycoplasmataceae bacterium]
MYSNKHTRSTHNTFEIKRMRTDHALDFKRIESLRTGEFNDLLTSFGIMHQY